MHKNKLLKIDTLNEIYNDYIFLEFNIRMSNIIKEIESDIRLDEIEKISLITSAIIVKESFKYWTENATIWKNESSNSLSTRIDPLDETIISADIQGGITGGITGVFNGGPAGATIGAILGAP